MDATSQPKSGSASPWIVIGLMAGAIIAFGTSAPIIGGLFILGLVAYLATRGRGSKAAAPAGLADRVAFLEGRVLELQDAVDGLRAGGRPAETPAPEPKFEAPPKPERPPAPRPVVPPPAPPAPVHKAPSFDLGRTVSAVDLMGAKALAFAGGVVTLLGVVFFFVLAVNRGWIGPELRVACGGLASAVVFGAGLWLQHRYERTYSALAAVGTGIAGGYVTLLAAVSLYDLVSKPVALVVAGAIASVGVAVSLAWSEEIVAAFGLIGAMLVPATLVFQGGLREIGTAFVAIVFAGATVVAVRERWWKMLQVAAVVSVPQALAQIADAGSPHVGIVVLAAAFWLLYLGAGLAFQLRLGSVLRSAPATFLVGGAVFAGASAAILYDGVSEGTALLVVAPIYVALAAVLFRRVREVALLLGALGLAVGAVGAAQVLSGSSLSYAWAAEAAVLAWLATRVRDTRFSLGALFYLCLALVHALVYEASPDHFFTDVAHPAKGAPVLLAIAAAAFLFGRLKRTWQDAPLTGVLRVLDSPVIRLRENARAVDASVFSLAGLLVAYAVSLGILALFGFQSGHVVVTAVWSAAGLVAVDVALRRKSELAVRLAFGWLGLTVVKAVCFDATVLTHTRYGIAFSLAGGATLLAGLDRELRRARNLSGEGAAAIAISAALAVAAGVVLIPERVAGVDGNGLILVAIGALYIGLAAATFARRNLSTLLWALGLTIAGSGEAILLNTPWLVLAYSATAAALAVLSVSAKERRLQIPSLVYLAGAAGLTLALETPPSQLVRAHAHPGHGLASLILVIAALATLAWAVDWNEHLRLQATWIAVALAVYGGSLAILEAAQRLSPGSVQTDFQRGQTAVSAFWGILALVSLYAGLRKRRSLLRGGGFILFAVSLGKIFLFDLPSLSSAQRALSFLAVGAVLLLGGFFYQRLSAQYDERVA
jgi:uncharacterized membrane protein